MPPLVDTSVIVTHLFEHLVHLLSVDVRVLPVETVAVGHAECLQVGDEAIVSAVPIDASGAIQRLIIVDPETGAPCLPVCPSVEGRGGHESFRLVCVNCRAQGGVAYPMVDTSAIVPIVPSVTLPASAVVVFRCEMVIEVPIPCHRSAAVVSIVHGLCHGEVGGFHQSFVCHVPSIDPQRRGRRYPV